MQKHENKLKIVNKSSKMYYSSDDSQNWSGMPWISIEYRENIWSFALTDLDEPGRTLGSPTASQIDSYHHVELSRGVLMCRDFAQLGLSSELAHLQCGCHL